MASQESDPCNVFVKNIPLKFDETNLTALFENAGTGKIVSAKVMLHPLSGASLGFGFVRFETDDEAKRAIELMNGLAIGPKRLLCKLSNGSKSLTNLTPNANLYIKPLPSDTTEQELLDMFSPFGSVQTVKVMTDKFGSTKGLGFVRFESEDQASAALNTMNGYRMRPDSAPLIVRYAETRAAKLARQHESPDMSLLMAMQNMSLGSRPRVPGAGPPPIMATTATPTPPQGPSPRSQASGYPWSFYSAASQAMPGLDPAYSLPEQRPVYSGNVAHSMMLPPPSSLYMSSPAYGTIVSPSSYLQSSPSVLPITSLRHLSYPSLYSTPTPDFAPPRYAASVPIPEPDPQLVARERNLFVFHLPNEIGESELHTLFSPFGPIESVKVVTDFDTGRSRGFGFVQFYRSEDARAAIEAMNGMPLGSKRLKVEWKSLSQARRQSGEGFQDLLQPSTI